MRDISIKKQQKSSKSHAANKKGVLTDFVYSPYSAPSETCILAFCSYTGLVSYLVTQKKNNEKKVICLSNTLYYLDYDIYPFEYNLYAVQPNSSIVKISDSTSDKKGVGGFNRVMERFLGKEEYLFSRMVTIALPRVDPDQRNKDLMAMKKNVKMIWSRKRNEMMLYVANRTDDSFKVERFGINI